MRGPLVGLRVLDIGHFVAGPLVTTLLADYGADVVKVERPGTGDPLRQLPPHKDGISLWWKVNARNKRCITLDFQDPADRSTLLELVGHADVVVQNFVPGTLDALGLGYDVMREANPGVVLLSISGFGQTGPMAATHAFGRVAEAFSGFAALTGYPDGPPLHSGLPVADGIAGVFGALAVMAAIYERDRNPAGEGQHVDLALYEAIFRLMEFPPVAYDQLGEVTQRPGSGHASVAPAGTWQTADGKWVTFVLSTQDQVRRLFGVLGKPELFEDPRFADNAARMSNREDLDALLAAWMAQHTRDDALERLRKEDLPVSAIYTFEDAYHDAHYAAREMFVELVDDELGPMRIPGVVPKFTRTPGEIRHAGKPRDADASDVLADWLGRGS